MRQWASCKAVKTMSIESHVIRDIDFLNLRPQAREIAEALANMIDLPIVYLVGSEFDLNYAGRHSRHRNQYWVTVKPQTDQNEYERIILSGLYRGVQERKRSIRACPCRKHLQKLQGSTDQQKRTELYFQMIGRINAVVTTVDAELFLKPRGYEVGEQQKQAQLNDRMRRLDEYLSIQADTPAFCWYPEVEIGNLLDYSRIASWGNAYRNELVKRICRIKPLHVSRRYLRQLEALTAMYRQLCDEEVTEPIEWMLTRIIQILYLDDIVSTARHTAYVGDFRLEDGRTVPQCSLVPEGIADEELMLAGMRSVNEAIVLLQEYLEFCQNQTLPDVVTSLILDNTCNAYANGTKDNGYFISVTAGLFRYVHSAVGQASFDHASPLAEIDKTLLEKLVLYFIAAHEYAHILGGDCDIDANAEQEAVANQKALQLMSEALFVRHRAYQDQPPQVQLAALLNAFCTDQQAFRYACTWCIQTLQKKQKTETYI